MPRAPHWLLLSLLACGAGCAGGAGRLPSQPAEILPVDLLTQSSHAGAAQAGTAGCHAVKFNVAVSPIMPGTHQGVMTGDVQGTVRVQFDLASVEFAGITISNSGTAHWVVTGGTVPGLGAFDTTFDNRNLVIDRPGSPATLFENIGRHRALGGVDTANLTYHGTFSTVPSPRTDHDYQGVICP